MCPAVCAAYTSRGCSRPGHRYACSASEQCTAIKQIKDESFAGKKIKVSYIKLLYNLSESLWTTFLMLYEVTLLNTSYKYAPLPPYGIIKLFYIYYLKRKEWKDTQRQWFLYAWKKHWKDFVKEIRCECKLFLFSYTNEFLWQIYFDILKRLS